MSCPILDNGCESYYQENYQFQNCPEVNGCKKQPIPSCKQCVPGMAQKCIQEKKLSSSTVIDEDAIDEVCEKPSSGTGGYIHGSTAYAACKGSKGLSQLDSCCAQQCKGNTTQADKSDCQSSCVSHSVSIPSGNMSGDIKGNSYCPCDNSQEYPASGCYNAYYDKNFGSNECELTDPNPNSNAKCSFKTCTECMQSINKCGGSGSQQQPQHQSQQQQHQSQQQPHHQSQQPQHQSQQQQPHHQSQQEPHHQQTKIQTNTHVDNSKKIIQNNNSKTNSSPNPSSSNLMLGSGLLFLLVAICIGAYVALSK